jgi:cytochrome d ubiquinol oxidase subunit II
LTGAKLENGPAMTQQTLVYAAAASALVGLIAYAVLAGADFGGGVWDLLATGPRSREQQDAIAHAMGPVWEANHVWLIFVIVTLFTCFPYGYPVLGEVLFVPFHLVLLGIMLRGAAFVFRGYSTPGRGAGPSNSAAGASAAPRVHHTSRWSVVFGCASVITPLLLGAAFGAVTAGGISLDPAGHVRLEGTLPWLKPYSIGCGFLALSTCAYLAAVYLTVETDGELREDFRRRAIAAGTATAVLALLVTVLAWREAHWFFERLISPRSRPVVLAGLICFAGSAWAVFGRRYRVSRWFAAGEIALLLIGWGLAQEPYLVYPSLTLMDAAAPASTLRFMLASLPAAALMLVPALWYLFTVFKRRPESRPVAAR